MSQQELATQSAYQIFIDIFIQKSLSFLKGIKMIYAYIKQSTQVISSQVQREFIEKWCSKTNTKVDSWIEAENDTVNFFDIVHGGDTIVVSDFARFGSSREKVMHVLKKIISAGVNVVSARSEIFLDSSKLTEDVFLLVEKIFSEVDFSISSENTKAGLIKAQEKGHKSGRRAGQRPGKVKLSGYEEEIRSGLQNGESILSLANKFNVQWVTMRDFIQKNL